MSERTMTVVVRKPGLTWPVILTVLLVGLPLLGRSIYEPFQGRTEANLVIQARKKNTDESTAFANFIARNDLPGMFVFAGLILTGVVWARYGYRRYQYAQATEAK